MARRGPWPFAFAVGSVLPSQAVAMVIGETGAWTTR